MNRAFPNSQHLLDILQMDNIFKFRIQVKDSPVGILFRLGQDFSIPMIEFADDTVVDIYRQLNNLRNFPEHQGFKILPEL